MPKHKKVLMEVVRNSRNGQTVKNKKRKKKKKNRRNTGNAAVGRVAAQLADPCGPYMSTGQYGSTEGPVARVHTSLTVTGTGSATCGYVLWCPDYAPNGAVVGGITETNLWGWTSSSSSTQPANSSTEPYGGWPLANFLLGDACGSTASIADPASALLADNFVKDMRTNSSCIRMTAIGKLMDLSGQVALLSGMSLDILLQQGRPSVNDVFNYASDTFGMTRDPVEVRWRPDEGASRFRNENEGALHVTTPATGPTTLSESAEVLVPQVYGIAWRGADITVGHPFVFDFIKNVEFRLSPISGLSHTPAVQVSDIPHVKTATRELDRVVPGWQTAHIKSFASSLSEMALGGAPAALSHLGRGVAGMLGGSSVPRLTYNAIGAS